MDQIPAPPPTPGQPVPPGAPMPQGRPAPQVVRVAPRASSAPAVLGGFARAIGFVAGMFVLGIVFVTGMMLGALTIAAGSMADTPVLTETYRDGGRDRVAVLPVQGVIDGWAAERFRMFADQVVDDSSVKAVVLRVDSPGGGVTASDQIWYQVRRLRNAGLPVVASYGSVAASGGYYISCATDHIVAEPTCITGSIGVIAQTFIFKDLMDKVGVEPVTLLSTDSPEKDFGNPWRAWTDADRERYVEMLDSAYAIFHERVRDGRRHVITEVSRVNELADGSVYTATQALESGLVDSVGYLDDAIAMAENLAGMKADSATVIVLHEQISLFGGLLAQSQEGRPHALRDVETLRSWLTNLGAPRLMYLMR